MTENKAETRTGSCMCGGVQFKGHGEWRDIHYCHCGQCHKNYGHFCATTNIAMAGFTFIKQETLQWYESSDFAKRGFCRHCGSVLFWKPNDKEYISVLVGAIDGDKSHFKASKHIFCADKQPYYEINDGLPQLAQY